MRLRGILCAVRAWLDEAAYGERCHCRQARGLDVWANHATCRSCGRLA